MIAQKSGDVAVANRGWRNTLGRRESTASTLLSLGTLWYPCNNEVKGLCTPGS